MFVIEVLFRGILLILRFVVRDFVYDEEELAASKNEISRLTSDKKKLFVSIQISKLVDTLYHCRTLLINL